MSLILSFVDPVRPARIVGPFDSVRVDGDGIREASRGDVVAQHEERQWKVKGERYSRLDVMSRTRVHFEHSGADPQSLERSCDYGPYERFSAAEGIAYADKQVLAFVSKLGDWFCCDDGRHWAVMVVTGAGWRRARNPLAALLALAPALPGVISLWQHARLLYLGRARSICGRVEALLRGAEGIDPAQVTDVMWENHPNPAAREAELHAEYVNGSPAWREAPA